MREFDWHGQKAWAVLARSDPNADIPEKSGVIRVSDYDTSMVMTSDGNNGTKGEGELDHAGKIKIKNLGTYHKFTPHSIFFS